MAWGVQEIPQPIFTVFAHPARHCREFGGARRARAARQGTPATMPMCAGCRVAVFCSSACSAAGWRGGHRAASPRWKRFGVLALEQAKTDAEAKRGGAKAVLRRAQFPIMYISRAGWQGDFQRWRWPASSIAIMEGTGLLIRDLIGLVDPDIGAIHAYPAVEFAQWPSVVPAQLLSRPLERDDGRVLRLVLREHPPRVLAFGICGQGMQYT